MDFIHCYKESEECAMVWNQCIHPEPGGDCIIFCRSYEAGSKIHTQLLILKEVLLRLIDRDIKHIVLCDPRKAWERLLNNKNWIHWEVYPAFNEICFLINQMQVFQFHGQWHPLLKEAQILAAKASATRMSYSWP